MINTTDIVEVRDATMIEENSDSELNVTDFSRNGSVTSMSSQAWGSTRSGKSYALTAEMIDSLMAFGAFSFKANTEGLSADSPETTGQRVDIDRIIPIPINSPPSSVTQFDNDDDDDDDDDEKEMMRT
jgi:hypothetical protein